MGSSARKLELGASIGFGKILFNEGAFSDKLVHYADVNLSLLLGYRYQSKGSGPSFKLGISPIILIGGKDEKFFYIYTGLGYSIGL